jgi:CheY-like chemotaxis protein
VTPSIAPDSELVGVRVLVADDDDEVLEWLSTMLSAFGLDVTTATSGDLAFARFVELRPDVLVSDVQMPGGSGLDLIRLVRALPPERGGLTPAIAISGAGCADETIDAGFHVHLAKPAATQTVIDSIREILREARGG